MLKGFAAAALVLTVFVICGGCKEEGDLFLIPSDQTAPTTTAVPPGYTYSAPQLVVLFADEPATIYYTTDGSDPTDSSTAYSCPILISSNTTLKFFAVDEKENSEAIKTEVYVIVGWGTPKDISNTDPNWSFFSSIAADTSGIAHVAWEEDTGGGGRDIFCAESSDWPASKANISNTAEQSYKPSVATDSNNVAYVVWHEVVGTTYQIILADSTGWTASQAEISQTGDNSLNAVVGVDTGDVVHVVWEEMVGGSNREIYYANSTGWAGTRVNISLTANVSEIPAMAVDSNDVIHVVWREAAGSSSDVYYANSGGWAATKTNVSNTGDISREASIAVDSAGIAHVVWREDIDLGALVDIYYANSSDWTGTQRNLSMTFDRSMNPGIAVDANDVLHLVWCEDVDASNTEICYANSTNWAATRVNISNTPEVSEMPSIAVSPDNVVHAAWRERVGVPYEIFYTSSGN